MANIHYSNSGGVGPQGPVGAKGDTGATGPAGPAGANGVETSFTVANGSLGTAPTFNGAPLFTGSYLRNGDLVYFQIQVAFTNITSFGTGQYYVDLPFPAKYAAAITGGHLHDYSASNTYLLHGDATAGSSRLGLLYVANGQDQLFDHNSPVGLQAVDSFHIAGTYLAEEI